VIIGHDTKLVSHSSSREASTPILSSLGFVDGNVSLFNLLLLALLRLFLSRLVDVRAIRTEPTEIARVRDSKLNIYFYLPFSLWNNKDGRLSALHVVSIFTFFTQQLLILIVFPTTLDATAVFALSSWVAFAGDAC
jgi:hypothetical protein